ncbi:hypothetical protein, partial [Geomesophilobacter sediminis]|uniref:hypothetical protein n=1 Tax=Geomesophilobacter sediminis TaxID=2798584 RepID=UPI001C07552A
ADGTAWVTVWESRSPQGIYLKGPPGSSPGGPFAFSVSHVKPKLPLLIYLSLCDAAHIQAGLKSIIFSQRHSGRPFYQGELDAFKS